MSAVSARTLGATGKAAPLASGRSSDRAVVVALTVPTTRLRRPGGRDGDHVCACRSPGRTYAPAFPRSDAFARRLLGRGGVFPPDEPIRSAAPLAPTARAHKPRG